MYFGFPTEECIDRLIAQLSQQVPECQVHSTDGLPADAVHGQDRQTEDGQVHV